MRILEVHQLLQTLTGEKITQSKIAKAIGTSRANVSKLFANNSFINDDKIKKIEEFFNVKLTEKENGINIDYYPENIVEKGETTLSKKHVNCKIPTNFFPIKSGAKYIMCHANENSMTPTIMNGDFIIIENSPLLEITNNKIYAFIYNGEFYIRRISNNINQLVITADNRDFSTQYIEKSSDDFELLGQVIYIGRVQI